MKSGQRTIDDKDNVKSHFAILNFLSCLSFLWCTVRMQLLVEMEYVLTYVRTLPTVTKLSKKVACLRSIYKCCSHTMLPCTFCILTTTCC